MAVFDTVHYGWHAYRIIRDAPYFKTFYPTSWMNPVQDANVLDFVQDIIHIPVGEEHLLHAALLCIFLSL